MVTTGARRAPLADTKCLPAAQRKQAKRTCMRINVCECFCSFLITHFTLSLTSKLKIYISRDFKISKVVPYYLAMNLGPPFFRYLLTW